QPTLPNRLCLALLDARRTVGDREGVRDVDCPSATADVQIPGTRLDTPVRLLAVEIDARVRADDDRATRRLVEDLGRRRSRVGRRGRWGALETLDLLAQPAVLGRQLLVGGLELVIAVRQLGDKRPHR